MTCFQYFDTIDAAYNYAEEEEENPLILIHSGIYQREFLVIDSNVTLLGAAPGHVSDHVIVERQSESTITFCEGAKESYLGYVTLKFSPDSNNASPGAHHKHYALEITEHCSPTIDHCVIRSSSVGQCV
jgi:F-box protein 11